MIRRVPVLAALLAFALPQVTQAAPDRAALLDYLGGQGCVIGPATRQAAVAAGFTDAALDSLADEARVLGQTEQQRDWLVLSDRLCTIRPPAITPALSLKDSDVRRNFSTRDAYADDGDRGCFLERDAMLRDLRQQRGWDADRANMEYLRLVGASLISGEMTFYSDTPLRTPMGFALLTGDCGQIPDIDAIRRDHALLTGQFDPLVRALSKVTICEDGGTPLVALAEDELAAIPGYQDGNAWNWLEMLVIAMGAGWYEGMSATVKGTPRPPFCHYE